MISDGDWVCEGIWKYLFQRLMFGDDPRAAKENLYPPPWNFKGEDNL